MGFGKSRGYCNQGAELIRVNARLERFRVALCELKERLTPIELLSEGERELRKIVDEALNDA